MRLSEQLKALRAKKGWTQEDLAKFSGVSVGSIKRYETDSGNITYSNLEKLASALGVATSDLSKNLSPSLSPNKNINLSPSVSKLSLSQKKSEKLQNLRTLVDEQENRLINLRFFPSVSAAAGYGANNDDESFEIISVTASFLIKILGVKAQEYDIIKVLGDSMEPFIKNGDMALILPTHEASNGEIIIANLGGDLYAKKLLRDPIKKHVRLTSMNDFYDDITIKGNELDQLKIVGIVKKVVPSGVLAL
ncbi:XRE family transcriptional regulator [Campylobacter sp. RM16191]|uniref:XRE family transcriptional regulator n=1 Tax=Campylobacter sp. RM16191 TaxID=1705728 RepID=UPI0014739277|nr:XRE family transcriptional regulator [Campylobacter sp. RM16191]